MNASSPLACIEGGAVFLKPSLALMSACTLATVWSHATSRSHVALAAVAETNGGKVPVGPVPGRDEDPD